ncbi:hypothetical protein [Desulfovibrio sp. UIB00]|uniref:hypothetical protein n=1 Tax=Desulfovibrio sp. UIB00 TaxID=2804314 RepID=UPI001F0E68CC|nr:hypothetical protein [Desulfovibrio sp. UIB00]MCH5144411.1 hypothetical protein [Desulfovibrio sp. UIB00]
MPPAKRKGSCRNSTLLDSLGQRLDLLTSTLSAADIAEKSIDIVKEIKELHAILRSLRDEASPDAPPRMVVVWGAPPSAASGRLPTDLSGASPRTSSKPSGASGKPPVQKTLPQYSSSN